MEFFFQMIHHVIYKNRTAAAAFSGLAPKARPSKTLAFAHRNVLTATYCLFQIFDWVCGIQSGRKRVCTRPYASNVLAEFDEPYGTMYFTLG